MMKGMYVTYDGSVYQVYNMQGAARGYAGMPVPATTYTLMRVDPNDTAASERLVLVNPTAAELPHTPPCSCGLRPGFCHGIHPTGFHHGQPLTPGDVVRFLYVTDTGIYRWGESIVTDVAFEPLRAPVVRVIAPADTHPEHRDTADDPGLLILPADKVTRQTDPRALAAALERASVVYPDRISA